MKYLPLYNLRIKHEYYADGRCPDFMIEAPSRTQRLLNNYHCVLKTLPDGIRLLTAADDADQPFISFPEVLVFTFQLRLENPDFALFTDLSEMARLSAPVFTNANQAPDQDAKLLPVSKTAIRTEHFEIAAPGPQAVFKLGYQPLEGIRVEDFSIDGPDHLTLTGFNATDNRITIDSRTASAGETFSATYPVLPKLESGVFADIAVHYRLDRHPPGDESVEFNIEFKARHVKWKYYVITDQKKPALDFRINTNEVDPDDPAPFFGDSNRTDLKQAPDPLDNIAVDLVQRFPQWQLFRFVSDDPIACRQSSRKNLQLTMNDSPIVGTLPNPSVRNLSEIVSQVGDMQQKEEAIYEIVKYLTQPFQ